MRVKSIEGMHQGKEGEANHETATYYLVLFDKEKSSHAVLKSSLQIL